MTKNYKRRQLFVDHSFQRRFIFKFCFVVVLSSFLIGGLIFYFAQNSTTVTIENTKVIAKPTSDFILPSLFSTIIIVSVLSALVVLILSLLTSHKIAGPIFRIKKEIDAMAAGDLTRDFTIRSQDQFQKLAGSCSEMANALRMEHIELKSKFQVLSRYLSEKKFHIEGKDAQKLRHMLDDVHNTFKHMKV